MALSSVGRAAISQSAIDSNLAPEAVLDRALSQLQEAFARATAVINRG